MVDLDKKIEDFDRLARENKEFCEYHEKSIDQKAHISFRNNAELYRALANRLTEYKQLKEEKTSTLTIVPKANANSYMCTCSKCNVIKFNIENDNYCGNCGAKFTEKINPFAKNS